MRFLLTTGLFPGDFLRDRVGGGWKEVPLRGARGAISAPKARPPPPLHPAHHPHARARPDRPQRHAASLHGASLAAGSSPFRPAAAQWNHGAALLLARARWRLVGGRLAARAPGHRPRWLATQSLLALPDRRRDSLCPAQLLRSFRERRRPGVRLPAGHPQTWTAAQLLRRSRCRLHRPLAQADLCGTRYPTTAHAGPGL